MKERWHERVTRARCCPRRSPRSLQWVLTFHVVCLAWIFFRADSVGTAFDVLGGILVGRAARRRSSPPLLAGHGRPHARQPVRAAAARRAASRRGSPLGPGLQVLALAGALTVIDVLGPDGVAPFIYFQF